MAVQTCLLFGVALSTLQINEAVQPSKRVLRVADSQHLSLLEDVAALDVSSRVKSKAQVMAETTLRGAYHRFLRLNSSSAAYAQAATYTNIVDALHQPSTTGGYGSMYTANPGHAVKTAAAVDAARVLLNDMIEEATEKKEIEEVKCMEDERKSLKELHDLKIEINYANSEAASARADVLRAQEVIQYLTEDEIPGLELQIREHDRQCAIDKSAYTRQLLILAIDIQSVTAILKSICVADPASATAGVVMAQLETASLGSLVKCSACGQNFAWFRQKTLQPMLDSLKSNISHQFVQENLLDAFEDVAHRAPESVKPTTLGATEVQKSLATVSQPMDMIPEMPPPSCDEALTGPSGAGYRGCQSKTRSGIKCQNWAVQTPHEHEVNSTMMPDAGLGYHNYCRNPGGEKNTIWCYTTDIMVEWEYCDPEKPLEEPEATEKHECIVINRCKLTPGPQCRKMRDRFVIILSSMMDSHSAITDELEYSVRTCRDIKGDLELSLEGKQGHLKEMQTLLAFATKRLSDAQASSGMANVEYKQLQLEYHTDAEECCDQKNMYTNDLCALEKIRGEVYRMEGNATGIADCEVSEWVDEECSVSCGGGTQRRARSIIVHPIMGAVCPPLNMDRSCNLEGCPVDCKVDDWAAWSECSSDCGGGVQMRARLKTQEPENGGEPCPEQTESRTCNSQSCNADCTLGDWGEWGPCSKQCDIGHKYRRKDIWQAARGTGVCADPDDEERLSFETCNFLSCANIKDPEEEMLGCNSMLDVIILMDGSGSLGRYAWNEMKNMSTKLVQAMHGGPSGVNVGFLLFSGPDNYQDLNACTGNSPWLPAPDLEYQCGIKWISHLTGDIPSVVEGVKEMEWPAKTTLTSMALAEARNEIKQGRPDAETVVIVITDGKPMSPIKTRQMSRRVRKEARLIWVPAGPGVAKTVDAMWKWASQPPQDNVIYLEDFASMDQPNSLNNIMATICPHVL